LDFQKNKKGATGTLLKFCLLIVQSESGLLVGTKNSECYPADFIAIEAPILEEAQLIVTLDCLRYSSFQTLSAKAPYRAAY
jgi:hypothetical protein